MLGGYRTTIEFEAKLELVTGNIETAFSILEQTMEIAKAHNLESYRQKVEKEIMLLNKTIEAMEETLSRGNLKERIQNFKIKDYVTRITETIGLLPQGYHG